MDKYKDRDWLYGQKIEANKSVRVIAQECGVDDSTISKWLRRFNIEYRIIRSTFILTCADCGSKYQNKGRKPSKDGKFRCNKCQRRRQNSKPKNKEKQKRYRKSKAGRDKTKAWQLKHLYGLTLEDYEKLLEAQKGVCAICKKSYRDGGRNLSVDHNHISGKVRGLLCDSCNRAIGVFKDDILTLQNAIVYLIRSEEDKSWDRYFINIAALVSTRSKDPSTQVGAVLVKENIILSTGYNGFPRGCDDAKLERYDRPLKYDWTVHAEENSLLNACRQGLSTVGSTLYVTPMRPCFKCARAIVQCGVKRVVCQALFSNERWDKDFMTSSQIIAEGGVEYVEVK